MIILMNGNGCILILFLAVALSLSSITLYSDFSITNFAFAHDGDGDGFDDDTLLPVVDEASNDPFPGSGEDFTATINATAIGSCGACAATNSTATATVTLLWSENQERLQYEITFTGINVNTTKGTNAVEALTKLHIHRGDNGESGPHALNIFGGPAEDDAEMEIHYDDNEIHGVWGEIDTGSLISDTGRSRQLSDMREYLCDGNLYFNIHTNWNPSGAIRGQIEPASELCDFDLEKDQFSGTINAAQVTAAGGTGKSGHSGSVIAYFNHTQDALFYRITLSSNSDLDGTKTPSDLSDDVTKIHIHQGATASNGDHLLNIFGDPCDSVPSPITDSCDDAQMEVNLVDNSISGVWDDTDRTTSNTDHNRSKKLSDHIGDLCNDETYIQVHFAGGNIRGQIKLDDHDLCDFNPNHSDFTSSITEGQIFHAGNMTFGTSSSASGTADFRFSSHGDELQYDVYLNGLDTDDTQTLATSADDLTKIHFHNAPAGTNGAVHLLNIFGLPSFADNDYILQPGNGTIFGIWDDDDEETTLNECPRTKKLTTSIDTLCADEVYINVHTEGFASGEIRGQILKTSDNIMCNFDLTKHADFTATLNECKLIRATINPAHECDDDFDHVDDGGHGHGSSSVDPEADVSMWFNDAMNALYYKIEFTGVDTTGEQTLDTTADDLKKIHLHNGTEFTEGSHAFNIIDPYGDADDLKINNGTRVVSGIWEITDTANNPATSLTGWYDELCSENLYIQIHNVTGTTNKFMRGQIEVNGHHNNICDAPELISAVAIAPKKIILTFDKEVDTSGTIPFENLDFGSSSSISFTVHNNGTNPVGSGIVTLITSTTLIGTINGNMTINSTLEDLIENAYDDVSSVTVSNALGGTPVTLSSTNSNVVLTSDSTLDELMVPDGVDATLDLTSTADTTTTGKTTVTIPSEIKTTVSGGTVDQVELTLPAGLEVTGNTAGFNGVLTLPSKSSCTATFTSSQLSHSCVEIGTPGVELTLSAPVKILLPSEAGNTPFYSGIGGEKTQISSVCDGADTPEVDGTIISSSGSAECFYKDGIDLIIWTTHFSSYGSFSQTSSSSNSGGGGRGAISSLMSPNLVLYNTCTENGNGIARILTQSHISRSDIGVTTIVDDFLDYGVEQTNISSNTYVKNANLKSYNYDIFDASIPSNSDSFWINVYDLDDPTYNVAHLINIPKDSCLGFDEVFPLKDNAEFIKPFEPLEIPDSWGVQELKIEKKYLDPNRLVFKLSDNYSNDFKTARDYLDFKKSTPEVIVESTPEVIVESTPEVIVESTPEVIVESTPEVIVESTPEVIVESTPEVIVESTPEVIVESTPEVIVESTPEVIVESTPEVIVESTPEVIVESTPEPYQCGRGTIMVDGFCKVTLDVTSYSEKVDGSESSDIFEELFKWFRIK